MTDNSDKRFQVTTETPKDLPRQFFKKSHELIFSQLGLTAREHDMMALFLTRLNRDHWTDYIEKRDIHAPRYTFHSDVLKDWFGLSSKQLYPTLRPVADRLSSRKVGLSSDDTESFDFIPLFARVQYQKGELSIVPNPELIKAYVDYSAGHAQISTKPSAASNPSIPSACTRFCRVLRTQAPVCIPRQLQSSTGSTGCLMRRGNSSRAAMPRTKCLLNAVSANRLRK
ncbi:replication initiation protein [Veronia nyctiphanis]|uniref:replication initiation protein n=1 Tax=Veronia nyctiphanis TaxID=1278244 RepID=UPI002E26A94E